VYKFVTKTFEGLKSFTQFLKIADIFLIMMLLLYWIQKLIGSSWEWTNFIKPLLDIFVEAGSIFSDKSVMLFSAVFEFKYFIALLLILFIYLLIHFCYMALCKLQELYEAGNDVVKRMQEKVLNTQLAKQQEFEQKGIQKYSVYVFAKVKKDAATKIASINLDEQKVIMNKFIFDKTGKSPVEFNEGYLYNFDNFDKIDEILEVLFKVIKSKAPLDYQICVTINENNQTDYVKLEKLISLGLFGKISVFSDTAYRYKFVKNAKYKTVQVGLFQKDKEACEIHEFIDNV